MLLVGFWYFCGFLIFRQYAGGRAKLKKDFAVVTKLYRAPPFATDLTGKDLVPT
jgi:hypothetical protein